jgi:predicted metal-binding membrane protein
MGSSGPDLTSRALRSERVIVAGSIALLVVLCWWYLAAGAGVEHAMDIPMAAPPPLGALVLMWWLMMLAMMLPSAAPAILLYGRVRQARSDNPRIVGTWVFLAGYGSVWLLFSVAAAVLQQGIAGPAMSLANGDLANALLIAAGLYQLSPFKGACLRQCRSPAQFLSRHWRPGIAGALRLGMLHGGYCVGCCWLLMALLFVSGVMNFAWIAALTLIVAVEKLAPGGEWIGRAAGVALIGWGAVRLTL